MMSDSELLSRYATQRDEAAFAELVQRHLDHVYSTALRLVAGDTHLAEDVAQAVFSDLARKAGSLRECVALSSWLHTSARFEAAKLVRTEQRRRHREQIALAMPDDSSASGPDWEEVRSFLDETIGELENADRDALLLRYFEKRPYAEIGAALGLSENAARMRVDRAVDKLRARLAVRGIASTAAALGTALAQSAVVTAPALLRARVASRAIASAGALGAGGTSWFGSLGTAAKAALATGAVVFVTALAVMLKPSPPQVAPAPSPAVAPPAAAPASQTVLADRSATRPGNAAAPAPTGIELTFLDVQTGLPITNEVIRLRGWVRGAQLLVEKEVHLGQGRCLAPFETNQSPFWILTHADGYADVRLRWRPHQGEAVPDAYVVHLVRPALIHGRVENTAGNPVAGATVGFNTENVTTEGSTVEDRCIGYLTAKTDANGRWQINRIAPEMVGHLFGTASHPEYSPSPMLTVSRQPELAQQLLDGTLVFRLGQGITVRGSVVSQDGQPIAAALVHLGVLDSSSHKDARTELDGTFLVTGCPPGKGILSAEAEGFAPGALYFMAETNSAPLQLTLGLGKPLRVQVVDPAGRPVAGASLGLDHFPRSYRSVPIPQIEFRLSTDAEGRAVWPKAPDQPLEFYATAPGYVRADHIELRPDDQEHLVTLQANFVLKGTVRDSVTGDLIPRFRLRIGWPEKSADGSSSPRWSDLDRFCLTFTGGHFRHSLDEAVIGGQTNPGYVFRFEADGHAPFVTRSYQPDEGEVALEVQLPPVEDIWAVAYSPDGQIARDAQVGFVAPDSDARLVPGGLAGDLGHALASVSKGDGNGRFIVPGDDSIEQVVIAGPSGYAEVTPDALRKAGAVRLAPWAALEGFWQAGANPATNAQITLMRGQRSGGAPMLHWGAFTARPDANGHFFFLQVPPGRMDLWLTRNADEGGNQKLAELELRPGETNQVTLGDGAPP